PALDEMRVAVSLARISNHPVSRAVAAYGCEAYSVTDCREVRGCGIEARLELAKPVGRAYVVRLGSIRWLKGLAIDLARADEFVATWTAKGATVLGITADQWLLGVLAVRDELRPGAAQVVRDLARSGRGVHLVTGDHPVSAAAIAAEVGISQRSVFAEASPEQKPEYVRKLQEQGHRVAFVGDGINDAPALEKADLGIAVSMAAEISRKAADMVLLRTDVAAVPEALGLARVTLRRIRQNLFWAFFYNAAAIPLAALGFLNPMLCAALMGMSDLVVVGNSLRIYWWKPFRRERWVAAFKENIDGPEEGR
ncbi:MAG TPA: HAD-IC family P-type ATPase, partial [Verrucomicrobiae bacterium]|nr:HAD-IC family P-type ATPase [Verrucomicrobiae bacterium]